MLRLGLEHPGKCAIALLLNFVVLSTGLTALTLTGLGIDEMRHGIDKSSPAPVWPLGIPRPNWEPLSLVVIVALGILAVAATRAFLRFRTVEAQARLLQAILTRLRTSVYDKLQRLSFRFFDAHNTGSIINRAASDSSAIANFIEFSYISLLMLFVTISVNFLYMVRIHPKLTFACLVMCIPILFVSIYHSRKVRPAFDQARKLSDTLVMTVAENVQGQHVIKGFDLAQAEIEKFRRANDALQKQQRWIFHRGSIYSTTIYLLSQTSTIILVAYGGYLAITPGGGVEGVPPAITVGSLIIFVGLMNQVSNQIVALAEVANTLQSSLSSAQRVFEILDSPSEIEVRPDAVRMPRAKGIIEFQNVSFGYKSSDPVLEDITFKTSPGQCVAIVGPIGTGKSTLLSLIPRFYDPTSGHIFLDGTDLKSIDVDDLRRNIGIVFQESFLFSNTIAANIAFGHPEATPGMIERAAKIAAAHDFIMELPKGYDTVIGEHGSGLSGGQRQRLAIARAILLEPSILLLDDATSALDPSTESEILQAMDQAMEGRTTFVVASRLSTLRRADLVIVIERGRIVQMGTHQELLKADGYYSDIAELQVADPSTTTGLVPTPAPAT